MQPLSVSEEAYGCKHYSDILIAAKHRCTHSPVPSISVKPRKEIVLRFHFPCLTSEQKVEIS